MHAVTGPEQLVNGGLYIFTGTYTNSSGTSFSNLVCQAINGKMNIARYQNSSQVITFNSETEEFDIQAMSYAPISYLAQKAPFLTWGSSVMIKELPTKETTLGKIIPTEENGGLNNLNYIEDEPTYI